MKELTEYIKKKALDLGFDLVGIGPASCIHPVYQERFKEWLARGFCAHMSYLQRNVEKRLCPDLLLKGAKSVIVVGLNYKPASEPSRPGPGQGTIAEYARYQDYHLFIKQRLHCLTEALRAQCDHACDVKVCVDSIPLAERSVAVRAGLGFIGKNHMLMHPLLGPTLLLGEVITTLLLRQDKPLEQDCGDCRLCTLACPTGALRSDGLFDASRCINYLTIEHKGDISAELASLLGNCLYGCDACIQACPFYQAAPACANKDFTYYPDRAHLDPQDVLTWTPSKFQEVFADSPVLRINLQQFQRNACICLESIS
jgi:epoxyqueuosine reductase